MSYESVLCVIKECFIYKLPPRSKAEGHRAADWDMNSFLFAGRLRVISVGDKCHLHIEVSFSDNEIITKSLKRFYSK
jgi:hypothetical protein